MDWKNVPDQAKLRTERARRIWKAPGASTGVNCLRLTHNGTALSMGLSDGSVAVLLLEAIRAPPGKQATCTAAAADPALAPLAQALALKAKLIGDTTLAVAQRMGRGDVRRSLANASDYLLLVGHVAIAWCWLRMAHVAQQALPAASGAERDFLEGKVQACRFWFATELPKVELAAALVAGGDATAFEMKDVWF